MKLIENRILNIREYFKYPTVTHHSKKLTTKTIGLKRIPYMMDSEKLKEAKQLIRSYLCKHKQDTPYKNFVAIDVIFYLPLKGKHSDGDPHVSKPDRDNLLKTLKDCMCDVGIIANDAQDFTGITAKIWSSLPGVEINLTEYIEIK